MVCQPRLNRATLTALKFVYFLYLEDGNDLHEKLADKCSNQLNSIVNNLDITDCQIKKLSDIYKYYEKFDDLESLLEDYAQAHPNYLNAQKYLYDFYLNQHNKHSLEIFHVK